MATDAQYQTLLAIRNTLNAVLAEMESGASPIKAKRKKKHDFAVYEQALLTGKRVPKPDHLKKREK